MPSQFPQDLGAPATATAPRQILSPVERIVLNLSTFTANTTVTAGARLLFDRAAVIREIWVAGSAIPSDADGTMLLNALLNDISEGADDTLVSSADLEALVLAANKAYQLTLATEGTENELTVAAGDTLRFTKVNNSAAIDTNSDITVSVLVQWLAPL
jgi:hypothetical protein